ncbi:hypothetical protein E5720_07685 [Rhodococcus sp. PAMC28707]|uniref:hypothetical protein n=1 Tax=unclassified Rhodococcus (in: high G+C Gram-positive bacteria) TaxID=192944 RepID=UPI00109E2575|nr:MULTISPECIES: hypothetical protein [unclassified Rhodococcus (in: high G+C Gram-positive bacteria)]QCB49898.1 hypothetical protein E5769_06330 [Rhodococcus sp. PAMC28705]QCB58409.1 hypothetical protein E5720_07685 [Rhodococcus sp. PAMC28707]
MSRRSVGPLESSQPGVLGPASFIAVAETSELIIDLDLAVLSAGVVGLKSRVVSYFRGPRTATLVDQPDYVVARGGDW